MVPRLHFSALALAALTTGCATTSTNDQPWVVPWAAWGWAILFGAILVFELFTLWWNRNRGDGQQRANLTAYVTALIGVGKRRLNRRMSKWIMVAFLAWLILHFLGYL